VIKYSQLVKNKRSNKKRTSHQ